MKNKQAYIATTILQKIALFRLFDDEFMSKVFENKECTELLLRIIMNMPDLVVIELGTQVSIKNLKGRSIRMDIKCTDGKGRIFNVEVQREDKGADPLRARYNSSIIDANILEKGQEHKDLPETFVIFITENDVWGAGEPIYHIDKIVRELNVPFDDKAHVIYVNGAYRGDDEIGKLMHDFSCNDPDEMNYKILADEARYYKQDEKGVRTMSKIMEEWLNEEKRETAIRMIKIGKMSIEEIAACVELTIEQVEELASLTPA